MNRIGQRIAALSVLAGLIAGCAPGAVTTPAASARPSATVAPSVAAASTAPASVGPSAGPTFDTSSPITLTVWDTETSAGPSAAMDALDTAFSAKYPNVTIKRTAKAFDDYVATIKLAASAPDAPDVFQGNEGYSVDAALVKAGLIVPLDDLAKAYGWDTRFGAPATLDVLRWSEDGSTWTKGPLWGIPQKAEVLGVFYNKDTLGKLGLQVPTTFAEFEASLAKAKEAKVAPIVVGGLDGWPLGHLFMDLQSRYEDAQKISDWTFGVAGSTFDTPETQKAAEVLQGWAKSGYFQKGFEGIGQDNAAARFAKGDGLYFLTGPWENGTFAGPMGDKVGFFALPPDAAGGTVHATGSPSLPFHISSKSAHQDAAAAYLDFITDPAAADVVAKNGDLPATPLADASAVTAGSSLASIVEAFQAKSSAGLLTPYLDWATPTMGDTMFGDLQRLMSGGLSPAEFTAAVQKDWSKNHQ